MKIDKILEKPVYLDRLKIEIQQLLTIDIRKKYYKQIAISWFWYQYKYLFTKRCKNINNYH